MSGRKLRWLSSGLFATVGAGMLSMTAMMNAALAFGDTPDVDPAGDIGLFVGASGTPIPGPDYVGAAYELYVNPTYQGITSFYQATSDVPGSPGFFGDGVFTPEGLYPLEAAGVHQLYLNYPQVDGLPSLTSSVGQGATAVQQAVLSDILKDDASTVFGYSQGSTLNGIAMQLLDPSGTPQIGPLDPKFLLIADPSNPNGGLLERFAGFETMSGQTVSDPLSLPSLGISFDGATPSDDYVTTIYSLEYDGFADFPRYPLNFLSDLNAFLGIADLHGTYLNGAAPDMDLPGPQIGDINSALLLPGSVDSPTDPCADCLTNYYMIDTIDGQPVTPPLVSTLGELPVIGKPLEDLLGPDLTVLINLGYGGDNLGYSDAPANIPTPFGLFPDVNTTDLINELTSGAQTGFAAFENDLSNPAALFASLTEPSTTSGPSLSDILTALGNDFSSPEAASTTLTDFANAISSAASTAYSTLLPTTDILNALVTSLPAYDYSLFAANLATGDLADAFGLPVAADTAIGTLAAGFEYEIISTALSQITADFSGLF